MKENTLKTLKKSISYCTIMMILLFIITILIYKLKGYLINDILFIEGLILIMLGVFASVDEKPTKISINDDDNLHVKKITNSKHNYFSNITFNSTLSTISIILLGIFSIIISYMI